MAKSQGAAQPRCASPLRQRNDHLYVEIYVKFEVSFKEDSPVLRRSYSLRTANGFTISTHDKGLLVQRFQRQVDGKTAHQF
jgi:hypothetical protein